MSASAGRRPLDELETGRVSQSFDWTDGCIAVTDEEMDEIRELVPDGTPITIRP